jgi:hypothetical protein
MINEKAGEEGSSTLACLIIWLDKFRKAAEENLPAVYHAKSFNPEVFEYKQKHTRSICG